MRKSRFFVTGIVLLVSIICLSACSRHERKGYYDPDNIEIKTEKELSEIRSKLQQNPKDLALNCAVWKYFTMWDMLDSLVVDASSVYNRAKSDGDSILMAYAGAYLGQAYFYTSRLDSMIFYFDRILGIAEKNRLYFPLIATYNNLSMYRIYAYLDYAGALDYLHQALSVIEASGNKTNYCATLCNMASVYFERKDLEGMKYAEKAYQLANADNNEYFILMSSLFLSRFHVLSGDSSEGLKYVRQVLKIVESGEEYKYYQVLAYSIYAELLSADGDYIAAEKYFRQAIGIWNENNSGFMEVMLSYCGYADLLLKQGRYTEAKHIIQYSSGLAIRKQSREALPEIYRILSDAHAGLRHPDSSLIYYKKYTAIRDSIYTVEKEREFNNLAMKYEKAKHDEEITKKELELSRQKRTNIIVYFMSAIFLLVACGIYYINARKNMMYRKLVEKDMERLKIKPKGSIRNVHEKTDIKSLIFPEWDLSTRRQERNFS